MPRSARRANRFAPIAISMATLCTMASHSASAQAVIVVRHGEKLDASADPILSPEGTARAERLANMLTASKVRAIYITQFKWIQLLEVLRNTAPRHTTQRTTNSETVGRRRIQRADWQRRRTAKNFSLLYKTEGPVLAPLYDALSTAVYPDLARKMAMKIGSKYEFAEVQARHSEQFATSAGLSPAQTKKRILEIARRLPDPARVTHETLEDEGSNHAIIVQIVMLIEQRCMLTIQRLTASGADDVTH